MPKPTFFNLSEKKRRSLIQAAEKEFSRAPLFEASISNIVKSAGISRGSFYQYFEDKEDVYYYILHEQAMRRNKEFLAHLKRHKGDLFEAITTFYYELLLGLPSDKEYNFFRNALLYVTYQIEEIFNEVIEGYTKHEGMKEILTLIDRDLLNVNTDKELIYAIQIITAVAFRNYVEKFTKDLTNEEAFEKFKIEMDLLKRGLAK